MSARDPSLALVLSGGGARGAFDAEVVEAMDDDQPISGIGDLLDLEPAVARRLVASGRRATRSAREDAAWN